MRASASLMAGVPHSWRLQQPLLDPQPAAALLDFKLPLGQVLQVQAAGPPLAQLRTQAAGSVQPCVLAAAGPGPVAEATEAVAVAGASSIAHAAATSAEPAQTEGSLLQFSAWQQEGQAACRTSSVRHSSCSSAGDDHSDAESRSDECEAEALERAQQRQPADAAGPQQELSTCSRSEGSLLQWTCCWLRASDAAAPQLPCDGKLFGACDRAASHARILPVLVFAGCRAHFGTCCTPLVASARAGTR